MIFLHFSHFAYTQTKLSLKDALGLARNNNPFYKAEKQNIDIAKSDITTARLQINPTVDISVQQVTDVKYFPENTGFFSSDNRQVSYQISKPFQVNGQRKYKVQQAQANLALAETNLSDYERTLLGNVALQWLDVWYAARKLEIINRAKINSDTLLKINNIRLKNQVITSTDYTRTQIVDEQYRLMMLSARQSLISETSNLSFMLGLHDSIQTDDREIQLLITIPAVYDSIINYALQNRTDILAAQKTVEKAKTDVSLQKAIAFPQPEVGIGYSRQNQVPYLGISFSIPIPFFDRNQGEIAKANVSANQAQNIADATIAKVKSEVDIAYKEYLTNKGTFENYNNIYRKSESVLNTVKFSYLKGGTTILDYLDAERSWFDLQNQYYDALYNFQKSLLQLLVVSNLIKMI